MSDSPRPRTEHTLLGTTDPTIWAEEFCRIYTGHFISPGDIDEVAMTKWFASAMLTALTQHNAVTEQVEEAEQAEEPEVLTLMVVLGEDDEPDTVTTMTSMEEEFMEGFQEGR